MRPVSWKRYIEKRKGAPPRDLLLEALTYVPERSVALDLGAGPMNDCRHLLAQGFKRVIAVDFDQTAKEYAEEFRDDSRFLFIRSRFEELLFPPETDLINASFSLPFLWRGAFGEVIKNIRSSLKQGGIFCGQLFGDRDEWNTPDSGKTFLTREEIGTFFAGMEIIKLIEDEGQHKSALGEPKHGHVFHLIARK